MYIYKGYVYAFLFLLLIFIFHLAFKPGEPPGFLKLPDVGVCVCADLSTITIWS